MTKINKMKYVSGSMSQITLWNITTTWVVNIKTGTLHCIANEQ